MLGNKMDRRFNKIIGIAQIQFFELVQANGPKESLGSRSVESLNNY